VLRNRYRSRTERHVADGIVRERYENNET